jgi:hypothetical protein
MQKQRSMVLGVCKEGFCAFSTFCRGRYGNASIRLYGASRSSRQAPLHLRVGRCSPMNVIGIKVVLKIAGLSRAPCAFTNRRTLKAPSPLDQISKFDTPT